MIAFSNFTAIYSNYDYQLAFGSDDRNKFEWDSKLKHLISNQNSPTL